ITIPRESPTSTTSTPASSTSVAKLASYAVIAAIFSPSAFMRANVATLTGGRGAYRSCKCLYMRVAGRKRRSRMNEGQGNINFARAELDTRRGALGAGRWALGSGKKREEARSGKREARRSNLPAVLRRLECEARVQSTSSGQSPEPRARGYITPHSSMDYRNVGRGVCGSLARATARNPAHWRRNPPAPHSRSGAATHRTRGKSAHTLPEAARDSRARSAARNANPAVGYARGAHRQAPADRSPSRARARRPRALYTPARTRRTPRRRA